MEDLTDLGNPNDHEGLVGLKNPNDFKSPYFWFRLLTVEYYLRLPSIMTSLVLWLVQLP